MRKEVLRITPVVGSSERFRKSTPTFQATLNTLNSDVGRTRSRLGATVRLKAQSGKIITGLVVHMWDEKSVPMVPASMVVDETKSRI
jgi:hypothetical protein